MAINYGPGPNGLPLAHDTSHETGGTDVITNVPTLGVGIATPDASSVLDIVSITKGMIPPRMTTIQRDAIATPVEGLFIYNTDAKSLNWYSGSAWEGASTVAYG